jgi:branched-chain amino acid transport system substrate-binding protein
MMFQEEVEMLRLVLLAATAALLGMSPAHAQDKLKIGVVATLSGPPAVLGQQLRNGFNLAVKTLGGKLGGREVEVTVADDELKPDLAVSKVKALVERDKVDFVVGPIFSNILAAIMKPATEGGAFLISPNAGTSNFAGKECNPNFFVTSYQNDQVFAVSGKHAQDAGIKKAFLMAPNYQAGKDALAGFKAFFKGEVADEVYVPLNQLDFSAELTKIAAAKPGRPDWPAPPRSSRLSRSMNRRCRRSRMPRSASSAAPTGRPISTRRRTRPSSRLTRRNSARCPRPTRSRPTTRRC